MTQQTPFYGFEPQFGTNAHTVLARRYFIRDDQGKALENETQMVYRVANNIAQAEKKFGGDDAAVDTARETFYKMIASCEFLPNSPTLMNAGKGEPQQLSACFVLPVNDSINSIFDAIKHAAIIHKTGGGTGFSFSRLRPKSDIVRSTKGVSSGPVSFMRVFNSATEAIKQGGARRGANMGILSVHHPDILEFIESKADMVSVTNFNISVAITEKFMEAVENCSDYDLINPRNKKVTGRLNARVVFDKLVDNAWRNGDPGIIFIDRINRDNPTPTLGEIESTNPCGEQPLLPYEACNLGSINLEKFLDEVPAAGWSESITGITGETPIPELVGKDGLRTRNLCGGNTVYVINWDRLRVCVHNAVHFLDNVIEQSNFPLPEIEKLVKSGNRKIGLGIMGFADLLFKMGIPYNTPEAVACGEKIMDFILREASLKSEALAIERGAFGNFDKSFFNDPQDPHYTHGKPRRNATVTTIAPTGTISIIAGCSSGIEPLFALSFYRLVMDNDRLVEVHPFFKKVAMARGFYSEELMHSLANGKHLADIEEVPADVREVFITAHDITPVWHLEHQAAFQRSCENAVSKTVNFVNSATREDVADVFKLAWQKGCKGVTIYRDGSRTAQVLNVGSTAKDKEQPKARAESKRQTPTLSTGKYRINIKAGGNTSQVKVSALSNLSAKRANSGEQLENTNDISVRNRHRNICPECRTGTLVTEEGCVKCYSCGYSKCG